MGKRVVIILGAGASHSISPEIPVMDTFFKCCMPFLEHPEQHPAIWLALVVLEQARCFPSRNDELENLASYVIATHWEQLAAQRDQSGKPLQRDTEAYRQATKSCLEWISAYRREFQKDRMRISANLELVFANAERRLLGVGGDTASDRDRAYSRLVMAVGYLFKTLHQKFPNPAGYNALATNTKEWLSSNPGSSVTFISFNYDIWLERSLQMSGLWHPRIGHLFPFEKFTNLANARASQQQWNVVYEAGAGVLKDFNFTCFTKHQGSLVTVLKPHGSLSWYREDENQDCVLVLENDEDSLVSANEEDWYLHDHWNSSRGDIATYEPFIVPPVQLKRRQHPIFWKIDRRIFQVVSEASDIICIGWSMSDTDLDYRQKLLHATDHRDIQLGRLKVYNYDPKERDLALYIKLESVFRPTYPVEIVGEGFTDVSIKKAFANL